MNYFIGYLIGFDGLFVLPAIIMWVFRKRIKLQTAKILLIFFFVLMTAGTLMSKAPIMIKGIAILIAAIIYVLIYRTIRGVHKTI